MATVLYRNAVLLINGAELTGSIHELDSEYACEVLDATIMGDTTRRHRGGLLMGKVSGKGFFDATVGIESVLFPLVGTGDEIVTIFPDGVTEGSTAAGSGYAMLGVLNQFDIGGADGVLLDIAFGVESQGLS